jgi:hypothetical protein
MSTFLELAEKILQEAEHPLTVNEIWKQIEKKGLDDSLGTTGKTPWATLGARLYVDVRDNPESKFVKIGEYPARFWLKKREVPKDWTALSAPEPVEPQESAKYSERDLHPVLSYFVYSIPAFNKGRPVYTKTIKHEKSTRSGYSEWTHPDMVGFSFPADEWKETVIELAGVLGDSALKLFSFELKRSLNEGNYREAFFQAVSNSSWAHEGYLVTAELEEDEYLRAELLRLSSSFGIGLILLDLRNVAESEIVFKARARETIDWETVNKLARQNEEFDQFLRQVKIDVTSKHIHKGEYDKVEQDIDAYVREKLKIRVD